MFHSKSVALFSQPYLDTYNQKYINIVTVNMMPEGPLSKFVVKTMFPLLSEFKSGTNQKQCGLALLSTNACQYSNNQSNNKQNLMTADEIPNLMIFLLSNGYTIDTSLTKMFNASDVRFNTDNSNILISFITYNG